MLSLNEFKAMMNKEENLLNDSINKIRGGKETAETTTTLEVFFDSETGEKIGHLICDDDPSSGVSTGSGIFVPMDRG